VKAIYTLDYFAIGRIGLESVVDVYAAYHQHFAIQFNFPGSGRIEKAFAGRNVTRFQRASKGSGQSTSRCGYHVVQGCGMGIVDSRIVPVVGGHLRMGSEKDRFFINGQVGTPNRPADPFNTYFGCINNFI
jgi:hypothetical protein